MYPAVLAAFEPFSTKFEGYLAWPYVDNLNLVTTGMGNLIDPVENALNLPWKVNGQRIDQSEIMRQWHVVKNAGAAGTGGGNQAHLSTMRLDDDGIRVLINQKLTNNESVLRRRIPQWDSLPADAQLAVLSMAWAMGANFNYPKFMAALNALSPDWDVLAQECWMPDNAKHYPNTDYPSLNPGLRPRNLANQQLFRNAKQAVASGDPSQLLFDVGAALLSSASAVASAGLATAGTAARVAARHPVKTALLVGTGAVASVGLSWWLVDPTGMKQTLARLTKG